MKSFSREFLRDPARGAERQIFLAAFGKHPGWDDHIDDLGLETESLVEAKRRLYIDGIGSQVGPWQQLDHFAQIKFDHVFVWRRETQALVGRLWMSTDGKKRGLFPMVVCAHCINAESPLVLETLLSWFDEFRTRAVATKSADEVRAIADQFRESLREWLRELDETDPPENGAHSFLEEIDLPSEQDALVKTLYLLRESAFSEGKYGSRTSGAAHFRLRASSCSALHTLEFWLRAFSADLHVSVPVLLLVPLEQYWLDVIVGEPGAADFYCVRASPRVVSMSSDEAPEPPPEFRETAHAILEALAAGLPVPKSARGSWMSRLFRGVVEPEVP